MKVWELRELLNDIPEGMTKDDFDNLDVIYPMSNEFDGGFFDACKVDSGFGFLSNIDTDNDEKEPYFLIVRCGFFNEQDGVDPQLN